MTHSPYVERRNAFKISSPKPQDTLTLKRLRPILRYNIMCALYQLCIILWIGLMRPITFALRTCIIIVADEVSATRQKDSLLTVQYS